MNNIESFPQYRLFSLKTQGKSEIIRYILAFIGKPYDDSVLTLSQWRKIKADEKRMQGLYLPILEIEGNGFELLNGAQTIAEYLAEKYGLNGRSDHDRIVINRVTEEINILNEKSAPLLRAYLTKSYQIRKQEWIVFRGLYLNKFLDSVLGLLKQSQSGWITGNQISWIDLALAELLNRMERCYDDHLLQDYGLIKHHMERVEDMPTIRQHLNARPFTLF